MHIRMRIHACTYARKYACTYKYVYTHACIIKLRVSIQVLRLTYIRTYISSDTHQERLV